MTEADSHDAAPLPQSVETAAGAGTAGGAASSHASSMSLTAEGSGPASLNLQVFRMPAHGPAYQAMHAMLQRRRQELTKEGDAAGAGAPTGATAAYPLGPPAMSLPHHINVAVAAGGGGQGGSTGPDPLQPMLSF
ncbi:hypothetical protein C2E21_3632 [Chlorella sorokiniana]|uniref:Uncharacterized protein n=1 Tax=Chlorella sorokiniana TaxID=3076 RepID=A0A2P6TUY1_CHLSO|nr:hypothetical protein C2E21_3632 [Chlorella sorokiniana]|eukprot:PRW57861.1 hypothetical protein C2E21_3632 [Chlorella sorokiniana]